MSRNNPHRNIVVISDFPENSQPEDVSEACDVPELWARGGRKRSGLEHRVGYVAGWEESVPELLSNLSVMFSERKPWEFKANLFEILVADLSKRIEKLESGRPRSVLIETFAPEPYALLKPFHISLRPSGDEFEASWFDAGVHTAGDNEDEAVLNLKSLILDVYDSLEKEPVEKLGPIPRRQLAVLKTFLKKNS